MIEFLASDIHVRGFMHLLLIVFLMLSTPVAAALLWCVVIKKRW